VAGEQYACNDSAVALTHQTLCYLFHQPTDGTRQVLLGRKLRGFGEGMIMGLGGHVEPGESYAEAALREVREESGLSIDPASLSRRARITYRFPSKPSLDAEVAVFFGERWSGTVAASDEIRPAWYPVDRVPIDEMWDDERYWLPRVLAGERLTAAFTFDDTGSRVIGSQVHAAERSAVGDEWETASRSDTTEHG
jgi:8-oxo-dGTP diphosphatase